MSHKEIARHERWFPFAVHLFLHTIWQLFGVTYHFQFPNTTNSALDSFILHLNRRLYVSSKYLFDAVLRNLYVRRAKILMGCIVKPDNEPSSPTCLCVGKAQYIFDKFGFLVHRI